MPHAMTLLKCSGIAKLGRAFMLSVIALLLMQVSQAANALLTITAPATATSTDADGTFQLSWTGAGNYVTISETFNGVPKVLTGITGTSGSYSITGRVPGTYYYRILNYCPNGPSGPIECDHKDLTVIVGGFASPTISAIANQTINEDSSTVALGFSIADADTAVTSLSVSATSSNTALISSPILGGSGASRTITATPFANASGTSTITISVSDGGRTTTSSFVVTVVSVNDVPTITGIANVSVNEGTTNLGTFSFTVNDVETAADSLSVTSASSNTALIPVASITLGGSGSARTVSLQSVAVVTGNSTITVTVFDGSASSTITFVATVVDLPATLTASPAITSTGAITLSWQYGKETIKIFEVINGGAEQVIPELSGEQNRVGSAQIIRSLNGTYKYNLYECFHSQTTNCTLLSDSKTVTVSLPAPTVTASVNTGVIYETGSGQTNSTILNWSSENATNCSATNIGVAGVSGTATYTAPSVLSADQTITFAVSCSGGGGTTTVSPSVLVKAVNDTPTISGIGAVTVQEDSATGLIGFTVADEETAAASLTVTATSSNTNLVPNGNLALGGSGASRTINAVPVANASGSTTITVTVSDGQVTSTTAFIVTVNAVNDAPTISDITNLFTNQETSTGAINFTVNDVEASALTVTATSSDPGVIANTDIILSGSGSLRTVTINLGARRFGQSIITVTVTDGVNPVSDTFTVTVNDIPTQLFIDANNGAGSYTLSWKYANETIRLFESRNGGADVDVLGEYTSPANKVFSKTLDGTYSYKIYECTHPMGVTTCTTLTDTKTITVTVPVPDLPVLTLSSVASPDGVVTASWNAVARANRFELYENDVLVSDGGNPLFTSKTYTGATAKVTGSYTYKVRACNTAGCSPFTANQTVNVAKPAVVTGVTASLHATTGIPTVSWTAAAGATRYEVRQGSAGAITSVTGSSTTLAAVTVAGSYTYQVRACADAGGYINCSAWVVSASQSIYLPTVPAITLVATSNNGNYTVSWSAIGNANRYTLTESVNGAAATTLPSQTGISYTPSTKPNGSYAYQLNACNAVGCSAFGSLKQVDVAIVGVLGAVTASMGPTTGIPSLSWAAVSGATRYTIQPQLGGMNTGSATNVTTNSATLAAVTVAGSYTYQVTACAVVGINTNCGTSVVSNAVTMAIPTIPVVTLPTLSVNGSYSLSWVLISAARDYVVNFNGVDIAPAVTAINFPVSGKPNGTYSYKVKACNALGCSAYSATKQVDVAMITAPTEAKAILDQMTGIPSVSWPVVANTTRYEIQRKLNGVDNGAVTTAPSAAVNATLSAVTLAGTYTFAVRACIVVGVSTNCSSWKLSNAVIPEIPGTPVVTSPFASSTGVFDVRWSPIIGATRYELEQNLAPIQSSLALIKSFKLLETKTNGIYYYRVRACKAVCGSYSNTTFTTVAINPGTGGGSSSSAASSTASGVANSSRSFSSTSSNSSFTPVDVLNETPIDPANDAMAEAVYNGALTGQQSVGQDGSFNYSLPIGVLPGIRGMQPNLQLSYNSNAKNGLLGWGWSLNGLSVISRCGANVIRDGYVSGINTGESYKYCIDGQRLVEVSAGEYRTESENYSRIQKSGNTWLVTVASGTTLAYGTSDNSRQEDDQTQTYAWHLDRQSDVFSNSWSVVYLKDTTAGTLNPDRIDYTLNPLLSAQSSVKFLYETRPDISVKYVAGVAVKADKRLAKVEVTSGGSNVKTYTLSYQQNGQAYHGKIYSDPAKTSRLASVGLCYSSASECVAPVSFDWSLQNESNYKFSSSGQPGSPGVAIADLTLDVDGDGKLEAYNDPNKQFTEIVTDIGNGQTSTSRRWPQYRKADVNHDGYDDVIKEFKTVDGIQVFLSNGLTIANTATPGYSIAKAQVSFSAVLSFYPYISNQGEVLIQNPNPQLLAYTTDVVDMNGDGLVDIVRSPYACFGGKGHCVFDNAAPKDISVALNTGTGFGAFVAWYSNWGGPVNGTPDFTYTTFKLQFQDMNGDGLLDFLATTWFPGATQHFIAGYNNGKGVNGGAFRVSKLGASNGRNSYLGDFNGDGLVDIAKMPEKDTSSVNSPDITQEIRVALAVGIDKNVGGAILGYLPEALALSGQNFIQYCGNLRVAGDECKRAVLDFNSDGLADIVEWGYTQTEECLQVPAPSNMALCNNKKTTYTGFAANVYVSQGGNATGTVSFAPPVLYNDLATLQSVNAHIALSGSGASEVFVTGFEDYNNDGTTESDARLTNKVTANKIDTVIEGGRTLSPQYASLTSDEIYQSVPFISASDGQNGVISLAKISGVRMGVKTLLVYNGVGSYNTTKYKYLGSKTHGAGYGDLGFASIEKLEQAAGETTAIKTVSTYHQTANATYKLSGRLKQQQVYTSNTNGDLLRKLSDTRYQWKVRLYKDDMDAGIDSPHYFAYVYESSTQTWDVDGTKISDSLSKNHPSAVPSCTPLLDSATTLVMDAASATDVDYHADGVQFYSETANCDTSGSSAAVQISAAENLNITSQGAVKGLVSKRKQFAWTGSAIASAAPTYYTVRTQGFTYNTSGQLNSKTIEPDVVGTSPLKLVTTFTYNGYGSVQSLTESWDDVANDGMSVNSRVTSIAETWGNGVHKIVVTKPLGIIETTEFNAWGLPEKQIDANGLVTLTGYDFLGRPILVSYPDGTFAQMDYRQCLGCFSYNSNAKWYSQTKTTGSAALRSYYDGFGREVGSRSRGLDGSYIYGVQRYNTSGKTWQATLPFYASDAQKTSTQLYDEIGRVKTITYPDAAIESRTYSGLTHTTINRLNQTQTRKLNAAGWVMRSLDNAATPVDFTYGPFGELKTTQVNNNVKTLVSVNYDALGRKTSMTDPNTGTVSYTYNGLGMTATQTDAAGQMTCFGYDTLGRQNKRVDKASATCTGTATQVWAYDSKPNGKGLLASLTGINTDASSYSEQYNYNTYSLPTTISTSFGGATYTVTQHYDAFTRPLGVTYPTGFVVANRYNDYGHMAAIKDSTGTAVWTANTADALGNLKQYILGNGVVTDSTYNPNTGRIASINATKGSVVIENQSYVFDSLGNLTSRTDTKNSIVQSFCYDGLNRLKAARFNGCSSSANDNIYDALGNLTTKDGLAGTLLYGTQGANVAGPHAVTAANGWSYQYDANGNLKQATKVGDTTKTVDYSPFNTPTKITQGSKFSELVYGPNQSRIKHSDSNGRVTKYVGGLYEEVTSGGITQKLHYIGGIALFVQKPGVNRHEYLHRDHIGSIVAITGDTVNTSTDVQWLSNGAWGERRMAQWNGPLDPTLIPSSTAHGFTDHEHLDAVGLIHMNGRVYDPELGRFLSADPFVQAPYNSQSYNRYAYVFNNPLSFTDPTGYQASTEDLEQKGYQNSASDAAIEEIKVTGERERAEKVAAAQNFAQDLMNGRVGVQIAPDTYKFRDSEGIERVMKVDPKKLPTSLGVAGLAIRAATVGQAAGGTSVLEALQALVKGARLTPAMVAVLAMTPTKMGDGTLAGATTKDNGVKSRIVVIGEGQIRVTTFARSIGAESFRLPTKLFDPSLNPSAELFAATLAYNIEWINSKMDNNYIIYDLGSDGRVVPSPFYSAEIIAIKAREYPYYYNVRERE
jgi:RHS repeat-associated protein